jgi:hypothetical protein
MLRKIFNYYNTNVTFHSFIQGGIGALLVAVTTYSGGVPVNKAGWLAVIAFFVKAIISWATRWAQQNVATRAIPMAK